MTLSRRTTVKSLVSLFSFTVIGVLLKPLTALAAWPKDLFMANKFEEALQGVTGGNPLTESKEVHLKAPQLAENGAVVPVSISTTLPRVESISLLIEKNPLPLAARFTFASQTESFVSVRIKMAESCDLIAVVKSGSQYFTTRKFVKVTIGGCGG